LILLSRDCSDLCFEAKANVARRTELAVAAGCLAHWVRIRTLHFAVTGPVLLIAGGAFLLSAVARVRVDASWVWTFVAIGTGAAFLLEWRCAKRPASRP